MSDGITDNERGAKESFNTQNQIESLVAHSSDLRSKARNLETQADQLEALAQRIAKGLSLPKPRLSKHYERLKARRDELDLYKKHCAIAIGSLKSGKMPSTYLDTPEVFATLIYAMQDRLNESRKKKEVPLECECVCHTGEVPGPCLPCRDCRYVHEMMEARDMDVKQEGSRGPAFDVCLRDMRIWRGRISTKPDAFGREADYEMHWSMVDAMIKGVDGLILALENIGCQTTHDQQVTLQGRREYRCRHMDCIRCRVLSEVKV